jgi:hypothetical protein
MPTIRSPAPILAGIFAAHITIPLILHMNITTAIQSSSTTNLYSKGHQT